jgi:cytochrome c oxidase subunit II
MNVRKTISVVTVISLITMAGIWYGANNHLLPTAASEEAELYDSLFNTLMAIATSLFLLVEGTLLFCVFRFRRRAGDETDGPPIRDNFTLELVWTAIPTVIVMFVGIYSFDVYTAMQGTAPSMMMGMSHDHPRPVAIALDKLGSKLGIEAAQASGLPSRIADSQPNQTNQTTPSETTSIPSSSQQPDLSTFNVDVTAMQYAWIFDYPGFKDLQTAELHLPLGSKVKLNLKASDVIHAFWVPQFRLKQDVIPGMSTQLQFTASKTGEYTIVCAELCGAYHGGMRAQLFVDTPEDFLAWAKKTQEELASNPTKRVIASNVLNPSTSMTASMTDGEYLAGRIQSMEMAKGIDPDMLQKVNHLGGGTHPDLAHIGNSQKH